MRMRIPWSTVGRQLAKALVWVAQRADKHPREILQEAGGEAVKEIARRHPSDPPPAP